MQAILQVLYERHAVDFDVFVESQTQILGEGAFTGAIETGHPNADLVFSTSIHGVLHSAQQLFELVFDAFSNNVLRNLRLQPSLLGRSVGDDLLNGAVDVFVTIEKRFDFHCLIL